MDKYAWQFTGVNVCPVILPVPLGRFFVLYVDVSTGPLKYKS